MTTAVQPGSVSRSVARTLLAGAMMLTTVLIGPAAARAATTSADPSGFTPIVNIGTGMCVQAQVNAENAPLIQAVCNGSTAQRWQFVPTGNGDQIVSQLPRRCIRLDGPVASGSAVVQSFCTGSTRQDWRSTSPPAETRIMSRADRRNTNLCLAPSSRVAGALLTVVTCNSVSSTQRWFIDSFDI
jgi:hypothetical protein